MADITVTREVCFTDYDCQDSCRPIVTLSPAANGARKALIQITPKDVPHEEGEPAILRALAACLVAAADEMEGRQ